MPPGRANGAPSDGASAAPPTSASASASQSATGSDEEPLISAEEALTRSWKSGFIFFCRHDSFRETFERRIFGLGAHKRDLVANVDPGTTALFLFDQTFRYIHGVYEAAEQVRWVPPPGCPPTPPAPMRFSPPPPPPPSEPNPLPLLLSDADDISD